MPSLACAAASAQRASTRQATVWARRCSALHTSHAVSHPPRLRCCSNDCSICAPWHLRCSVDLSSTFYALNPSGDLADTQSAFQDWFSGMRGWQVRGCAAEAEKGGPFSAGAGACLVTGRMGSTLFQQPPSRVLITWPLVHASAHEVAVSHPCLSHAGQGRVRPHCC